MKKSMIKYKAYELNGIGKGEVVVVKYGSSSLRKPTEHIFILSSLSLRKSPEGAPCVVMDVVGGYSVTFGRGIGLVNGLVYLLGNTEFYKPTNEHLRLLRNVGYHTEYR